MIREIIGSINIEISEQINISNANSDFDLVYSTNGLYTKDGFCEYITFLGIRIWDSENSVCYFDDEPDIVESIEHTVRKRVNEIISNLLDDELNIIESIEHIVRERVDSIISNLKNISV